MAEKKPRIVIMGEEVDYDEFPGTGAVSLEDHFKNVRLSPRAIDEASKIVPIENWKKARIYTWLQQRANHVFQKLPSSNNTVGTLGVMKYFFEFDAEGPVLKNLSL